MLQRTHTEKMAGIATLNLNKAPRPGMERAPTSTNLTRPMPIQRLEGKVVFITGGGGKVGVESAGRLLIEGCNVALVDINQQALEAAIPVLKAAIPTGSPVESRLLTIVADATKEADIEASVKKCLQRFDKLDAAVLNCCERGESKSIFDITEDDFDRIMGINAKSAFLGVKYCGAAMQTTSNGGSIVLRSSIAGLRGFPGLISYSSAKFALRGIALTAAEELGEYGIRVNTIHTSIIDTPGYKKGWSAEKLEELKDDTALHRFSSPDDVASVVAFLVSEDSKFMTGGHLKIDGGCVAV